jgi:DNA-binding CsgD family transcriptional regulator
MRDWLDITRVVRLHAAEPHHRRESRLYDGMRAELRAAAAGEVFKPSLWLAHCALAATWANELGDAETAIELLMTTTAVETQWVGAMVQWLYGLVAEARGKGALARTHLRAAIEDSRNDLPFYRAHMLVDYARIVHVLGDPVSAELARTEATEIYTRLGAPAYVDRVAAERRARAATSVSTARTVLLTEREQDVLTLVTSGMSYAQIARDLFVTRSTVNYHLSNIYRKAQVGSRHDLTELYRKEPLSFRVIAG